MVEQADPADIRNFLRLTQAITTSGRLQPGDPARLAAVGTARVINLALADHPEALPDAEREMASAGIAYTHLPVPFGAPTEAHYQAFRAALEAAQTPVHVHCIMNWRVSAFFYRWHREACGMAEAEARAWLEKIWSPHTSDSPEAAPWRAFVERVES
jgi:uncharacterized protein (TIGR01244 family)